MCHSKNNFVLFFIFTILLSLSFEFKNLREIDSEEIDNEEEEKEKLNVKPPSFSSISGFYPNDFKLKLISEEDTTIYYTLDSTDPRNSPTSVKFEDYILIYDRSLEQNIYSSIGTNESSPISISTSFNYKVPSYPVDKAMIVRAVCKNKKGEFSEIITKTYFITTDVLMRYQDLTVISIVTDPKNLFDPDIGIYVTGTMYIEEKKKAEEEGGNNNRWRRNNKCNYFQKGKEWEREAFVTIFDKGEINVQQNMGIRIKGAYTRSNPSKSFNLYAKKKYGKSILETDLLKDNYDIKGNLITSYKSLSLRNIYEGGRLLDKFGRDLFYKREGLSVPEMLNSILFLNGEYWGLYLIQEKIDSDFISSNYLIPSENIVLAKANEIDDGPDEEYDKFIYFCGNYSKKDVSDEKVYSEISNYIDINSFVELYATGIYIANQDWPANNDGEWRYFGEPIKGNKYSDGRWRFIMYDLDYSMGADFFNPCTPDINMFTYIENRRRSMAPINLYLSLIKNNYDFQNRLANMICDYANEIYKFEIIEKLIEKYREEYSDLVANSQLRWSGKAYSSLEGYALYKSNYYKFLDKSKNFFEERPKYIFEQMKDYLHLKGELVDLTIEIKGKGKIQINSIIPTFNNNVWKGKYFSRIPIKIKAIDDNTYSFKEWSGFIESNKQEEEFVLLQSQKIIAVFD